MNDEMKLLFDEMRDVFRETMEFLVNKPKESQVVFTNVPIKTKEPYDLEDIDEICPVDMAEEIRATYEKVTEKLYEGNKYIDCKRVPISRMLKNMGIILSKKASMERGELSIDDLKKIYEENEGFLSVKDQELLDTVLKNLDFSPNREERLVADIETFPIPVSEEGTINPLETVAPQNVEMDLKGLHALQDKVRACKPIIH